MLCLRLASPRHVEENGIKISEESTVRNAVEHAFLNAGPQVQEGFRNRGPGDMARRRRWMTKLGAPLLGRELERDDREDKLKLRPLKGLRVSNRADSSAPATLSGLTKRTGKGIGKSSRQTNRQENPPLRERFAPVTTNYTPRVKQCCALGQTFSYLAKATPTCGPTPGIPGIASISTGVPLRGAPRSCPFLHVFQTLCSPEAQVG